jgi:DNA polymerase I-like protein with 3'-5' exonuclease and polymerase domains/RecA-family ATPase
VADNWHPPSDLPDLRRAGIIAIDTEEKDDRLRAGMGSGWPFRAGHICGVSVAWREGGDIRAHYFPLRHPNTQNFDPAQVFQWFRDLIASDVRFVTQNGLYDWGWLLAEADIKMPPGERLEEIGALATMIDENRFKYGLNELCKWRGLPGKDETLLRQGIAALGLITNKRKKLVPQEHIWQLPAHYVGPYAEADAINTLRLYESLDPILNQEGTRDAYRLECDILPMVQAMRWRGIRIDLDAAKRARDLILSKRDAALTEASEKLGSTIGMHEIQSSKWLTKTFDRLGIKYPRTEKGNPSFTGGKTGWMAGDTHWLPPLIATANKYDKAATDFVQKIIDHSVNGRIHAEINPHRSEDFGTKSFRLSYSDPPLQQMPSRDEELAPLIRGIFLPEPGEVWLKPDCSQQEFRFVVHYANQHKLPKAAEAVARYRDDPDADFHALAAALTKLERTSAKAVNFAKIYGAGVHKFATMIGKPLREAQRIYKQYDRELPFLSQLSRIYRKCANDQGYITLYDGARRHFDRFAPNGEWKKNAGPCSWEEAQRRIADPEHPWHGHKQLYRADTRNALNAQIQGSAARHTKLWMLACWRAGITPLLQMHDCLDCSISSREQAELIARLGCDAVQLDVPMRIDLKYGWTWGDATHSWEELHNGVKVSDTLLAGHLGSDTPEIMHHEPSLSVEHSPDHCAAIENPAVERGEANDQHTNNDHSQHTSANDYRANDDKNTGKPYPPVRTALLTKGYRITQTFPFTVPGATEPLFYEDRYELWAKITSTKQRPRKTCRFWHRDNGREFNGTGPRRIIYNWPAIMAAGPGATVFITEGANKSKPLNDAGLLAAAVPYHKWEPECVSALADTHVIYLEDHDLPDERGCIKAKEFSAAARNKLVPVAASFRLVPALHLWKNLGRADKPPHGWDVKNWLEQGGNPAKLLAVCCEIPADGTGLVYIDMSRWDFEPTPEQEWIVYNRIPRRECVLFSGIGGSGKSITQLFLSCATVLSRDWLGITPEQGSSIFVDAEDDEKVLHRRAKAIAEYYDVSITDLIKGGLHLVSWRGCDAALATISRNGIVEPTALYRALLEAAGDIKPATIGIAASANVFAGNENDRAQVQQFIGLLTRVAMAANGSLTLISHPSIAGINTDSGLSGSTQWHNSVRARYFMREVKPEAGEPLDTDLRELVFKKNNYGSISESIMLRWNNGLFLPESGAALDQAAKEAIAEEVFLALLKRFATNNRKVGDKPSANYAPALFAVEDEAKRAGLTKRDLERAMRRLFQRNAIWNEPHGKPSRPSYRIAPK